MTKEQIYLDLSKCTESELKKVRMTLYVNREYDKSPHEICCIAQIIREAEKSGLDYTAIETPFTPLKK